MDTRLDIINALNHHIPGDDVERCHTREVIKFINKYPKAFDRDHEAGGHVGATAVVLSASGYILLTQHKVEKTWAFFGNHCEGQTDLIEVARQRIVKDAGEVLAQGCVTVGKILDVDIHNVPQHYRNGETVPQHLHYDIAFLFTVPDLILPATSNSRWFKIEDAKVLPNRDPQFIRILNKISH